MRHRRLPDFLIIGAMKAGTTTIFRWLGTHPGVLMPSVKEPAFFAHDARWNHGLDWYSSLFPRRADVITGEASVIYTHPKFSAVAATRIETTLPEVKLIFSARDPIERARSQYVHQVHRGREARTWADAWQDPTNPYLARSNYWACLQPYLASFPRERFHIVSFERLFSQEEDEWLRLLAFLGLAEQPKPPERYNRSSDFRAIPPALSRAGARRVSRLVPRRLKATVKTRLAPLKPDRESLIRSSREGMVVQPEHLSAALDRFLKWAETPSLWDRDDTSVE